jgi:signal transduction histidine kinase
LNQKYKILIKSIFFIAILPAILLALIGLHYHNISFESSLQDLTVKEKYQAYCIASRIDMELNTFNSDISIIHNTLKHHFEREGCDYKNDNFDVATKDIFMDFSTAKPEYIQLRLLDSTGMEIIRVNNKDNTPYIVAEDELQNKSNRYYIKESHNLNENQIYVSRFDLNMEHGKVELPHRPVLRFVVPLFNKKAERVLSLVINIDGTKLIKEIESFNSPFSNIMILDYEGYWLSHKDTDNTWGFMYDDKRHIHFIDEYPDVFNEIITKKQDQILSPNGLFSYAVCGLNKETYTTKKIISSKGIHPLDMIIISHTPPEVIDDARHKSLIFYLSALFVIICLLIITAVVSAKIQLKKYREKIHLLEEKTAMEQSNNAKNQMFATVSHDMKNIVALQLSYSELLTNNLSTMDTQHLQNFAGELYKVSKSSSDLLENLLFWSRAQMDKILINNTTFLFYDISTAVVHILEHNAKAKDIEIIQDIPYDIQIFADVDIIRLILRNIISNAIKFSYENSQISISAIHKENFTECTIIDSGVGISEENIAKIMDTNNYFTTAGTNYEKGTGLGMNMCINFIQLMGGNFKIKSNVGEGTKIIFTIPNKAPDSYLLNEHNIENIN